MIQSLVSGETEIEWKRVRVLHKSRQPTSSSTTGVTTRALTWNLAVHEGREILLISRCYSTLWSELLVSCKRVRGLHVPRGISFGSATVCVNEYTPGSIGQARDELILALRSCSSQESVTAAFSVCGREGQKNH